MSSSKKKGVSAKRRSKPALRPRKTQHEPIVTVTETTVVRTDIHREIQYITKRAQAEEARTVGLGKLVLFSTWTGDAWLLDTEDNFAMCLCRDGQPQPFRVIDGPERFAIDWPARFAIDGDTFIVEERSGRVIATQGYPTAAIADACQRSMAGDDSGFDAFR
jgi:hypothetical protein